MATEETKAKSPKKIFNPTYTIDELVAAAAEFETSSVVVRAALTKEGKTSYTKVEATRLIRRMKNKEVSA